MPSGLELRIDLMIRAEPTAYILAGSITENLPAAANKKVTCLEFFYYDQDQRRISCFGVGSLDSTTIYHIAF
jgi:hypothetical protein